MEILSKLSAVQTWSSIPSAPDAKDAADFETLRARFMAAILTEYRKFSEVANVRNNKKKIMARIQVLNDSKTANNDIKSESSDSEGSERTPKKSNGVEEATLAAQTAMKGSAGSEAENFEERAFQMKMKVAANSKRFKTKRASKKSPPSHNRR